MTNEEFLFAIQIGQLEYQSAHPPREVGEIKGQSKRLEIFCTLKLAPFQGVKNRRTFEALLNRQRSGWCQPCLEKPGDGDWRGNF